jgi:hypothetical protein
MVLDELRVPRTGSDLNSEATQLLVRLNDRGASLNLCSSTYAASAMDQSVVVSP